MSRVSIVVVNYGTGRELSTNLNTLRDRVPTDTEILVVDNGSPDDSVEVLRREAPFATLIEAGENRGFSAGCNHGLRAARGDFLLLLNPDAVPEPGAVLRLADVAGSRPDVGVVGGVVTAADGRPDPACARPLPLVRDILWEAFFLPKRRERAYRALGPGRSGVHPVGAVSGAAMGVSRATFEALGPMDENYFLYNEDVEWCERAHRLAGGVVLVADARFVHAQGSTTRRNEGRPFTARMLADFQYFVEGQGLSPRRIRRHWWIRQAFRRWFYALDVRFKLLGGRPGSPDRVRIYGALARAARRLEWSADPEVGNAHPERLPRLSGVDVP